MVDLLLLRDFDTCMRFGLRVLRNASSWVGPQPMGRVRGGDLLQQLIAALNTCCKIM